MSAYLSITRLAHESIAEQRQRDHVKRFGQPVLPQILASPAPIERWPDSKVYALLTIFRSDCARDCMTLWGERARQTQTDFVQLRDEGLAFKRELGRYHELTAAGRALAIRLTKLTAQRLQLHHVYHTGAQSNSSGAECTCGWRCSFDRRYGGEAGKVARAISVHLGEAKGG